MLTLLFLSCKRLHFLERTVASIREHLATVEPTVDARFICFDNGSSPEDRRRLQALDFDELILSRTNLGIGPAMNHLVSAIRTPYALNLQDDWVIENPQRVPFIGECLRICESDPRIAHIKVDACHFLDFKDRRVYDGPFQVSGGNVPFFVQNPHMMWGGFSFPPAITRVSAFHELGPFREDQPFRRGWAESEFSGRFTQHFVAAKSPHMVLFRHIGDEASPGWEGATLASSAVPAESPVSLGVSAKQPRPNPSSEDARSDLQQEARTVQVCSPDEQEEFQAQALFPALDDPHVPSAALLAAATALHERYVTRVSTPAMAASLACCLAVFRLARAVGAQRILDLGSGVSSALLRMLFAAEAPQTTVVSVDTDPGWLGKTKEFLTEEGISTEGLAAWEEVQRAGGRYDVVFYDLGSIDEHRCRYLGEVLGMVEPGGILVADDVHFSHYGDLVERTARSMGRRFLSLRPWTEDSFHRFAAVVV